MEAEDKGHRYGNFPNYYNFHPPQNRLLILEQCGLMNFIRNGLFGVSDASEEVEGNESQSNTLLPRKKPRIDVDNQASVSITSKSTDAQFESNTINYCDLGCNAGDLTMSMASALTKAAGNNEQHNDIKCLGLDIDAELIQRANNKYSCKNVDESTDGIVNEVTAPVFQACNLCLSNEHDKACSDFYATITNAQNSNEAVVLSKPKQIFSLTTIFSTTMWIHIHAGDDGLREFLERACGWTKRYILIEPQHSGCYRKANVRLRKMKRPEIDVTEDRLKMRSDIETEIERVVIACGFRRIRIGADAESNGEKGDNLRTAWKRTLQLYERIDACDGN